MRERQYIDSKTKTENNQSKSSKSEPDPLPPSSSLSEEISMYVFAVALAARFGGAARRGGGGGSSSSSSSSLLMTFFAGAFLPTVAFGFAGSFVVDVFFAVGFEVAAFPKKSVRGFSAAALFLTGFRENSSVDSSALAGLQRGLNESKEDMLKLERTSSA